MWVDECSRGLGVHVHVCVAPRCVSVVSNRSCVSGQMVVGEMCEVVERKKKYSARVHATGIHMVVQCE